MLSTHSKEIQSKVLYRPRLEAAALKKVKAAPASPVKRDRRPKSKKPRNDNLLWM